MRQQMQRRLVVEKNCLLQRSRRRCQCVWPVIALITRSSS